MDISELAEFGIDNYIIEKLRSQGFNELTEVQRLAIQNGLFDHGNILVSAPTNTGKTFIGELAALVSSTKKSNRSFYLVPLKAIADEKFDEFSNKYREWGLQIAVSTSDRTEFDDDLLSYDLVIATYEKLNALIIRNPKLIQDIGLVVVDELQYFGDSFRGTILEVLLTRMISSPNQPQIIGLSATLPNSKQVSEWLGAKLVETNKRDIELREGVLYYGNTNVQFAGVTLESGDFVYREYNTGKISVEKDLNINTLKGIANISKTEQSIVFTDTQGNAEKSARLISRELPVINDAAKLLDQLDTNVEPTPSTRVLKDILMNGVSFHHAGLLSEERRIVENGFREGLIRVICSTTTLGAGVNTPAKNVIVLDHKTWKGESILAREYKNMAGRAGRIRTKDNFGRSILFAGTPKDLSFLWSQYVTASVEPVESQMAKGKGIVVSILGLISCDISGTKDDLLNFIKMSFFGYTYYKQSAEAFHKQFDESIDRQLLELEKSNLITQNDGKIRATELGKRCAEELLQPSTAVLFVNSIKRREQEIQKPYEEWIQGLIHLCCCVDDGERALLYEPNSFAEKEELQALWKVNVSSFFVNPDPARVIKSLRTTRMLLRWIEGVPYPDLRQYAAAGIIRRNAEIISWLLKGLARILEKPATALEEDFQDFLVELRDRIYYGIPKEALEIMRMDMPSIHRGRAIVLANAGYGTLDKLIEATVQELGQVEGIGEKLALRIKKHVENYIDNETLKSLHSQARKAKEIGHDEGIIQRLYAEKGDEFAKVATDIFKIIGLDAVFIGESAKHGIDILVNTPEGAIVMESKRKSNGSVGADEAEQILGRGGKHNPISRVTVGYPYFSSTAAENAKNTKVTLLKASAIGEMLIAFWEGNFTTENAVSILKSGRHIKDISNVQKSVEYR